MSQPSEKYCLDPVYYDSTPWEFYLIELDISIVREYFDDPGMSRLYAKNVHRAPIYDMDAKPWEFSRFVQLKHSPWMRFDIAAHLIGSQFRPRNKARPDPAALQNLSTKEAAEKIVEDIRRDCANAWNLKKSKAAFLSELFETQAMLFGYEDTGDTLYYELYEKGYIRESFIGGLYDPNVSTTTTFCELKSEIRPGCKPKNDKKRFVDETFALWKVAVPFVSLLPDEKNPRLLRGSLASCSVFSQEDIKGFDCALIDAV